MARTFSSDVSFEIKGRPLSVRHQIQKLGLSSGTVGPICNGEGVKDSLGPVLGTANSLDKLLVNPSFGNFVAQVNCFGRVGSDS